MPSVSPKQKKLMAALSHDWKPKKPLPNLPSKEVALRFHRADYPHGSSTKKAFDVAWRHLKS